MAETKGKAKSRLGRGLSALVGVPAEAEATAQMSDAGELPSEGARAAGSGMRASGGALDAAIAAREVVREVRGAPMDLAVEEIRPNPHQPRRTFAEAGLAELAASMKSSGVIQPVVVKKAAAGGYELIAGERRLRAAKLAGLAVIPAIVREVDALAQAQMALVENIQREDLNPVERAQGYKTLMTQLGLTQAELAGRLGEERSSVANYLRLLDLAGPVQEMLRAGRLSFGHAKLLAGVSDMLEQQRLAELIVQQGLSVRNLERLLEAPPKEGEKPPAAPSAHLAALEKSIARQLGLRVQVRSNAKGRGKLVVHYSDLDQFDALMGRLGVKIES